MALNTRPKKCPWARGIFLWHPWKLQSSFLVNILGLNSESREQRVITARPLHCVYLLPLLPVGIIMMAITVQENAIYVMTLT